MNRRLIAAFAALTALLALSPAAASAAPQLSFAEVQRVQPVVYKNDLRIDYKLKLRNIGDATTTGTTALALGFPAGVQLGEATGAGWACDASAALCTRSAGVAQSADFPQLSLRLWSDPEVTSDPLNIVFTASGGGSSGSVVAEDTINLAPAKPFEITSLAAVACAVPPGTPDAGLCGTDFGSTEYTAAGAHPHAGTASFAFSTRLEVKQYLESEPGGPVEEIRNIVTELPAGLIGNLKAVPGLCTFAEVDDEVCPTSAAVGGVDVETTGGDAGAYAPLFRIVPEDGYVAAFAFNPVAFPKSVTLVIRAKLRANGDYGVTAVAPLAPQSPRIFAVKRATLCSYGVKINEGAFNSNVGGAFGGCKKPTDSGANPVPFLTNPTRCGGDPPVTTIRVDSWKNPGALNDEGFADLGDPRWKSRSAASSPGVDCVALTEAWTGAQAPSFSFQPDSERAAAAAGYTAKVHIPKAGLEEPGGTSNSHLKDTTVTLPEGIALNPSAADGLGVCSLADAGYLGKGFPKPNQMRFKTTAPGCPGNSKIGTAEVSTPVLENTLPGAMYLAAQDENPFGSKFAVYLVIDDPKTGVKATIPGEVKPDKNTGRITTTFSENPQAPIEDVEIDFFDGPRASLVNPDVCGGYNVATEMTPWSAADPYNPQPNEIARPGDTVKVGSPAAGQSSCPSTKAERPFGPGFEAGSQDVQAGAHTKFSLRITRGEGEQELSGVKVMTPPGFAATLKGVAICSEDAVRAAKADGRTGKSEMANPSCPAGSYVGSTTVGAGAGPNPFYVKTGKVYLSGPYKGAPLSFTFIVPAVAGPFDLGVQVVRAALNVDPQTAAVTAVSDPLPQILEGVPLQVRDVRVELDRANFALNPTNCEPMSISAELTGGSGAVSKLGNRFQVGGCEALRFKPRLKLQLHGSPKRAEYQRLVAKVTAKRGEANIARTAVTFPHSIFLAQEHIRTVCTRVQFAADACPKGSIYGRAEAKSPLLDGKLTGPVYLRSSDNLLPDVVVALRGPDAQPIEVELAGRVDSKNQGIRNSFELVPDAPVSKFTLRMFGGEKSLLINSRHLCKGPKQKATVRMTGHNGKRRDFRTVVGNDCGKKKGKSKKKKSKQAKQSGFAQAAILPSWPLGF